MKKHFHEETFPFQARDLTLVHQVICLEVILAHYA